MLARRLTAWMIIPTFYPVIGGAQSQVQRLSKVLITADWSVHVLTRRHSYAHPQGLPATDALEGVPIVRLYSRGNSRVGSLLYILGGLWYLLRRGRRSIYHAHDIGAPGWLAVAARYLLGGRSVIKLRTGCYAYERYFSTGLARWHFRTLLRLADRVIVVNSEVEKLLHQLGVPAWRVVCIPNGVDTNRFRPVAAAEKLALRHQLGLSPEQTLFLYIGRLEAMKGVDVLLRAWALLPEETRKGARLLVIGDGPERAKLQNMVASSGIGDSVQLTGEQLNVRDYYGAADLFVLPSRTEGLSNALIEAMACGLPVVASNVGGALDLVLSGENGLLFKSEDEADLARKLDELSRVRPLWEAMGQKARQSVIDYADLAPVMERLQDVYQDLLTD